MTMINLPLPLNILYEHEQTLDFEKIVTFIGGNGSGKSTILKSIFDTKLSNSQYKEYKIVCFSSGQNESYSERFAEYLNSERLKRNALNLDCFYYNKSWSKLLIFLATSGKINGYVRNFLKENNYIEESEFDEDISTKLSLDIKVDKSYINLVNQALQDEAKGKTEVITNKAYHQTLHNFINALVSESYSFELPLEQKNVQLEQSTLASVSFEADEYASFDSVVMFFTQAADNDYFFIKESFNLTFLKSQGSGENLVLKLEDLSDGEYQILFLYSLLDLFDTNKTIFLFDEADSHLHYKNIDKLWDAFKKVEGYVITTTHLLDSINKSGIDSLKVVEYGKLLPGKNLEYLCDRLKDLSEINNVKFKALSFFDNVVLIDDENDWEIFKLLLIKKLANSHSEKIKIENELSKFIAVKCHSGYEGKAAEVFGGKKLLWSNNFIEYLSGQSHKIKNIYMICDRDELPLTNLGTDKSELLVQGEPVKVINKKLTRHLLSWKRREVKHYLLSYTALEKSNFSINDELDLSKKSMLIAGKSGDLKTDNSYNENVANLKSDHVKKILDPFLNGNNGFSKKKAKAYVEKMLSTEISSDIVNMYNYLVNNK